MISWILIFSLLFIVPSIVDTYQLKADTCPLGLTVSENGELLKDCKPYKAVGVNYFDAFYRVLKDPTDKSYVQGFEKLSKNGIPFVRMMACGFWPNDWEIYLKDKERYFTLLDDVVKTAEKYNVGIIMTLFWNVSTIPDLVGEPVSAWGDPESKTISFMKNYTREVVSRYKDSPAIWGWEFGNEYNLIADLPKGYLPKVAPQYGTPKQRTERDRLTYRDILTAFIQFADTVREIDKHRIISTGNSIPRPSAYHLAFYGKWQKDSLIQFLYMLNLQNPKDFAAISVHIYPPTLNDRYFMDVIVKSFEDLIRPMVEFTKRENRILFIGEFGVCKHHANSKEEERIKYEELIKTIEKLEVPLSALWVYDRKKPDDSCNVSFENERSYQLWYIIDLNRKINENITFATR